MLKKASEEDHSTAFSRAEKMKICAIGDSGICCRNCVMGPCRLTPPKKEGDEPKRGICGATAEVVAARNFVRMIAGGTSAHSDHGRAVAETLILAAKGGAEGYRIKDRIKLIEVAADLGIEVGERTSEEIALEVGRKCLAMFGQQEGEIEFALRAPEPRQEIWRKLGVFPRGIDREVVETIHRTSIGVDQEMENILLQGTRCSLADGWGGSMIATELQDILFGTPTPVKSKINLGVLEEDQVNIIVHGHEPILSEMVLLAAQSEKLLKRAEEKGARGINISGICCTANEILSRHGIPIAGNVLQQEMAILTGAVDAMVVDVQCVYQAIGELSQCFHTKIITTSPKAKMPFALHIELHEENALEIAEGIVEAAIDNFPNRGRVDIPDVTTEFIGGYDHEYINYMLGGKFRASYRPLNDGIIDGRIRGVVGVVGCNNPRVPHESVHVRVVEELVANGCLVAMTGCAAQSVAKTGLMSPETAKDACPQGLYEICETVGIPPVLHVGSCVDNSRILVALNAMVQEGGLGSDVSDLPVAGAAPEWMSEKAVAIGNYFVASGVYTVIGVTWPVSGSQVLTDYLFKEYEKIYGGMWDCEPDPDKMVGKILSHIDKKREALGILGKRERVLYDMAARRELSIE
ncbi:MAG: anaerobic carbon-monoxide dehydrogenase catalytic subunit [Actinobacteria bacterium]|nr:anaerobic carbon-monoxide dehydrogenase catalytic subunit [Actinomycetota bacterium]MBU4241098.1 anaerobic carbon-monoxide dehydrogenase catalytic subunit [Actinomycetota bacterium]MBU4301956.1 anaerobic carbon-monoxide dehydrogenase catalytic subunit [Actinomycetota bacterium]MBU4490510.1 anaerobic carbon-monoxide dehydrogenase catalytic subunit [Actinomycetota bacterium]